MGCLDVGRRCRHINSLIRLRSKQNFSLRMIFLALSERKKHYKSLAINKINNLNKRRFAREI